MSLPTLPRPFSPLVAVTGVYVAGIYTGQAIAALPGWSAVPHSGLWRLVGLIAVHLLGGWTFLAWARHYRVFHSIEGQALGQAQHRS